MSASSEPPLIDSSAAPAAAPRVVVGLILWGAVDLLMLVVMAVSALRGSGRFNLTPSFLAYWAGAWLVWRNKKVVWPIMAYLSAFGLGGIIGSLFGLGLGFPAKLIGAVLRNGSFELWLYMGYTVLSAVFSGWLLFESSRVSWIRARSSWAQPRICMGLGMVLGGASVWGIGAFLQAGWTKPIVARARSEYGESYSYLTTSYSFNSNHGQSTNHATVLAYSEKELKTVSLNWAD